MKTIEQIEQFKNDMVRGYEALMTNPENYEQSTIIYAKKMMEDAVKWHEEALKNQNENRVVS